MRLRAASASRRGRCGGSCFSREGSRTGVIPRASSTVLPTCFAPACVACGYEDAADLDFLRSDPAFKLLCGRLPDTGHDLCSQPTPSRLENAPRLKDVIRLTYCLVDAWMDSYERERASVTLDIDDTCDVVMRCAALYGSGNLHG
jgi:hypothetical protein